MTGVRFLQTDHLRLGSPLSGLCECPEWLRNTVSCAVRRSVASMFESAIAEKCRFVLISGRITEHPEDWNAAIQWLLPLLFRLHQHRITLVLTSDAVPLTVSETWISSIAESGQCPGFRPLILKPSERLEVTPVPDSDQVFFRKALHSETMDERVSLTISVASSGLLPSSRDTDRRPGISYVAVPGITPDPDGRLLPDNGIYRVTAGSPQAVGPEETGAYGGRIVDVDLTARHVSTQITATDIIRYAREILDYPADLTEESIRSAILERSRSYRTYSGRTIILEWIIDGRIPVRRLAASARSRRSGTPDFSDEPFPVRESTFSLWSSESLYRCCNEVSFLAELRAQLESGHCGVWPGRVRFLNTPTAYSDTGIRAA